VTLGNEREDVAEELRRVRENARGAARRAGDGGADLKEVTPAEPTSRREEPSPDPEPTPEAPDATAVNAAWTAEPEPARGLAGLLRRGLDRLLRGHFEAQRTFNAHQVRLDNDLLRYVEARIAATHRHYDRVLGREGRRLDEIDARHVLLEKELAGHVRDLVRRVDVVLAEATRGRAGLEFELQEVRERLVRLEEALRRRT
jgi:hypothetical protein